METSIKRTMANEAERKKGNGRQRLEIKQGEGVDRGRLARVPPRDACHRSLPIKAKSDF